VEKDEKDHAPERKEGPAGGGSMGGRKPHWKLKRGEAEAVEHICYLMQKSSKMSKEPGSQVGGASSMGGPLFRLRSESFKKKETSGGELDGGVIMCHRSQYKRIFDSDRMPESKKRNSTEKKGKSVEDTSTYSPV